MRRRDDGEVATERGFDILVEVVSVLLLVSMPEFKFRGCRQPGTVPMIMRKEDEMQRWQFVEVDGWVSESLAGYLDKLCESSNPLSYPGGESLTPGPRWT